MMNVTARFVGPVVAMPGMKLEGEIEVAPIGGAVLPITRIDVIVDRVSSWRAPARVTGDRDRRIHDGVEVAIRSGTGSLFSFGQHGIEQELWRRSFEPAVLTSAQRFPIEVIIPSDTIASHASTVGLDSLAASVRVTTHVIGPQLSGASVQLITIVPSNPPAGGAATARSTVGDLELGIASTSVARGTQIVGTVSGAGSIAVELIATVHVVNPPGLSTADITYVYGHSYACRRVRVELPTARSGTPFVLEVPSDTCPTIEAPTHSVSWSVRASSREFMDSRDVSIPIVITVGDLPTATVAPKVGDSNVEPVFASYATLHGWKLESGVDAHDPRLGLLLPSITREEGEQHLMVAYAYRGGETYLVSRIAYPSLELGLDVVPSGRLREMFSRDLQAGVPGWDRHYHADAREREPAEALLRSIVPQLPEALGAIVHWTDDELVCEVPSSVISAIDISKVADALGALAGRLAGARPAVPPPAEPYR